MQQEDRKYAKILINENQDVPINLISNYTIEQQYDYLHHSHYLEDLPSVNGDQLSYSALVDIVNKQGMLIKQLIEAVNKLNNNVPIIFDYDVLQPGIQNENGETISTLDNSIGMVEITK